MPCSGPPHNDRLAGNWLENKWLTNTKIRFFELTEAALRWPPVSHTFCFAGIDPKNLYKVTYGSDSELRNTLHSIYVEYGSIDLQLRGRDEDGNCYLKCSQPGHKRGPAKAVICVSPAKVEKDRTAAAETEPWQAVVDGKVQGLEDWEQVTSDVAEEEDDWVKV